MRAVVVGGGLAGLAAALRLVDSGHRVTLLEARPTLGGAVQTLPWREGDPEPPPDNGQHIALGCFAEYRAFLERIGKAGALRRRPLELPVVAEDGSVAVIRPGALSLLRYGHLSPAERLRVALVTRKLASRDEPGDERITFARLLGELGQRPPGIERFWDVFVRPALNLPCEEAGAAYGVFTVRTALLGGPGDSDLLLPAEPLGQMHGAAAARALEAAGAEVRTEARAAELEPDAAVLVDGERVAGEAFVVALPPAESARLLGEADPELEDSPIVSVHLLVDRPLLAHPLAALLGSPAHWVFDRGLLTGKQPVAQPPVRAGGPGEGVRGNREVPPWPTEGQYLTVVSSGAPELLELRGSALADAIAGALRERLGHAEVLWSRVSREPRATFAPRPGTDALRRGAAVAGRPNVVRAGAWTATGWPATMEGAVRSGNRAAGLLSDVATKVIA